MVTFFLAELMFFYIPQLFKSNVFDNERPSKVAKFLSMTFLVEFWLVVLEANAFEYRQKRSPCVFEAGLTLRTIQRTQRRRVFSKQFTDMFLMFEAQIRRTINRFSRHVSRKMIQLLQTEFISRNEQTYFTKNELIKSPCFCRFLEHFQLIQLCEKRQSFRKTEET